MTRITEAAMATVVKAVLGRRPNKSASFVELRKAIPTRIRLTKADRAKSPSRPAEERWEQIVRNLVSHNHEGFVRVAGGIRLQWRAARPKVHALDAGEARALAA